MKANNYKINYFEELLKRRFPFYFQDYHWEFTPIIGIEQSIHLTHLASLVNPLAEDLRLKMVEDDVQDPHQNMFQTWIMTYKAFSRWTIHLNIEPPHWKISIIWDIKMTNNFYIYYMILHIKIIICCETTTQAKVLLV